MKKLLCLLCFVLILSSQAMADVAITSANFPDNTFRNYVNMECNTNGDDVLSDSEILKITKIDVKNYGIGQLDGIEYFTSLTELICSGNRLKTLDVSNNTALTTLDCSDNRLTELDVSNCTELVSINCINNQLTELDVGNCSALTTLNCSDNQLTKLDVSYNDALTYLNCGKNQLAKLYVSDNTILTYLNCFNNQLTKLYVSENNTLTTLYCGRNKLTRLYVRKNTALTILDCGSNQLGKLDLSDNAALTTLYCNNNLLTDLYVSENAALTELDCGDNQLMELDVSKNTILSILKCNNNKLTYIDLSKNMALEDLDCDDNQLTTIDLSKNKAIKKISCENQKVDFFLDSMTFDFSKIISSANIPNIITGSVQGLTNTNSNITTTYSAGVAEFEQFPATIRYDYSTGRSKTVMPVSIVIVTVTKPKITTSAADAIETNTSYRFRFQASGINPITWSLVKGKMIKGLTLSSYGLMSGTVTKAGKTALTLQASNAYGTAIKSFNINSYLPPEITTTSLKAGTMGKAYKANLSSKGSKPFTWLLDGNLPKGVTFNAAKGSISGTPAEKGTYRLRLTLSNPAGDIEKSLKLTVNAIAPKITGNMKKGTEGKAYKSAFKVTGTAPITVRYSGKLPKGLSFDEDTLTFSGTPTEICTDREITIIASNIEATTTATYKLTINGVAPKFTVTTLPSGTINTTYSADIKASGTAPVTFSASGLPQGLTMNTSGHISGTPTEFGTFSIAITAQNSIKTITKKIKMTITLPPVFGENILKEATRGKSYTHKFDVDGTAKINLTRTEGTMPQGMSINGITLKGTPKEAGTFTFTLTAANSVGTASKEFTLSVIDPAAVNTPILESAPENTGDTAEYPEAILHEDTAGNEAYVPEADGDEEASHHGDYYIVVCELPEISVNISGMYDLDIVLSDNVRVGSQLLWFAGSDEPSEDDEIAEFYDEEGEDTETVPESRNITVSVWFNEGRTYHPKIAVK